MARWDIEQNELRVSLYYTNLQNKASFNCGDNRPDTPLRSILEWCAANAQPGDVVFRNNQALLYYGFPGARA